MHLLMIEMNQFIANELKGVIGAANLCLLNSFKQMATGNQFVGHLEPIDLIRTESKPRQASRGVDEFLDESLESTVTENALCNLGKVFAWPAASGENER